MGSVAAVFVRRSGADGIGHVGWAFDCGDQSFNYEIDASSVQLEAAAPRELSPTADLPDLDSLLTGRPEGIEPAVPPWRTPNTSEWFELQAAMAAAPAMPASAHHSALGRIRHLLGID